jgi:adenine phosphoribosyltransferase
MDLTARIRETIRDVRNFPKQGIIFKDITPVLANPDLSKEVSYALAEKWRHTKPDGIIGIESRGFIYGMQMAQLLSVPFIPVRKA